MRGSSTGEIAMLDPATLKYRAKASMLGGVRDIGGPNDPQAYLIWVLREIRW